MTGVSSDSGVRSASCRSDGAFWSASRSSSEWCSDEDGVGGEGSLDDVNVITDARSCAAASWSRSIPISALASDNE